MTTQPVTKVSETALQEALFKPENLSCPHAIWAQMRRECPVLRIDIPGMAAPGYVVTKKADLEFAAIHPEIFSSQCDSTVQRWGNDFGPDFAPILAEGYLPVHTIVSSDPPKSRLYRNIVMEALSLKRVAARRPELQRLVDELIAALPRDGSTVDFRPAFAVPLPLRAIMDVYALPRVDADFIYWFTCECLQLFDPSTDLETAKGNARALVKAQNYLAPLIQRYRASPADNFLSFIANARTEEDDLLSMEEALSVALITLLGGNDTTRNAILIAARVLANDRALWDKLVATPDLIPAFVEEIIRTGGPAALTVRQTKIETELSGVSIPAGAAVYMMWASGSRDESAFTAPDEIRLDRTNWRQHTSFGYGTHSCAGLNLARTELLFSVQTWIREFESFELVGTLEDAPFEPRWSIRTIERLPVKITFRGG